MERLAVRLRPFEEGDLWYFDRLATDREFSAPFSLVGLVDWRQNERPGAGVWERPA